MIKDKKDEELSVKDPPSYNQVLNSKEFPAVHVDKTLRSESCRSMPTTPPPDPVVLDRFHIIKDKLKQNTPATQMLPMTRRNPREAGNLFVIVLMSMAISVTVLYFITPLAEQAGAEQSPTAMPGPPLPPLSVYFVVSGSVPISSSSITKAYSKYLQPGSMTDPSGDDITPRFDHTIRFTDIDLDSLKQITRTLLADDLMQAGVASVKLRSASAVTLLCSSLFVSEYCGQTWSAAGCPTGKTGVTCDECLPGRYGSSCQPCPNACAPHGVCDGIQGVGQCICESGWDGPSCTQPVPS